MAASTASAATGRQRTCPRRMGLRRGPFPRNPKIPSPLAPVPVQPPSQPPRRPGGLQLQRDRSSPCTAAPCVLARVRRSPEPPLRPCSAESPLLDRAASAPLLGERDWSRPCSAARLRPAGLPSRAPARDGESARRAAARPASCDCDPAVACWSTKCVFRAQMCIRAKFVIRAFTIFGPPV
jgi:hypothetical protein